MATEEQLQSYADTLPPIYREILAAFPRIEPHRRQGQALAFQTLAADFEEQKKGISLGEIIEACQELEQHHLVKIVNGIFVQPLLLGERLIVIITGQQAPVVKVPPLPAPPG